MKKAFSISLCCNILGWTFATWNCLVFFVRLLIFLQPEKSDPKEVGGTALLLWWCQEDVRIRGRGWPERASRIPPLFLSIGVMPLSHVIAQGPWMWVLGGKNNNNKKWYLSLRIAILALVERKTSIMKAELACYLTYRCCVLVLLRGAGLLHQEHGSQGSLTSVLGITAKQEGAWGRGRWSVMDTVYTRVPWHEGEMTCSQGWPFPPELKEWHQKMHWGKSLPGKGKNEKNMEMEMPGSCSHDCVAFSVNPWREGQAACPDGAGLWLLPNVPSFPVPCLHFAWWCSPQNKAVGNYCKPIFCCRKQ